MLCFIFCQTCDDWMEPKVHCCLFVHPVMFTSYCKSIIISSISGGIAPCTIVITDKTTSSLEAQWGECQSAAAYYLDIQPRPPGSGSWPRTLATASLDDLIYTYNGLDAGTKYTVLLGLAPNDPPQSTETAYTSKISIPLVIDVVRQTSSLIHFENIKTNKIYQLGIKNVEKLYVVFRNAHLI